MSQTGEASVEEILESIKKVIARDNRAMAQKARSRREPAGEAPDSPEPAAQEEAEEILDLDEASMVALASDDGDEDAFERGNGKQGHGEQGDGETGDLAGESSESDDEADRDGPLLNDIARSAMRDNLAALAMLAQPPAAPQIVRSGETSLEGLVRHMLRPMLAEWLDANLPGMVERLVQAEIQRIAGKKG